MLLHELVTVSSVVAGTRGRLDKVASLAQFLQRLRHAEIPIAVAYLSGSLPQGRIGVGWSVVSQVRSTTPATHASLELRELGREAPLRKT